jgi:ATP-dependent DNA helicase RecQ
MEAAAALSDAIVAPESHLARFGLASFRPGQREVVETVLERRDCLCIMPTGGGKSLCYQLPAVARPGLTLVVSPLIALMKDQVDALHELGIAATYINSSLTPAETFARMNAMAAGLYSLVYVAPERLRSSLFLEKLRQAKLNLLAVDEAHCISQWGHDFRPDYARLGRFRQRLGSPPTIALTATATPHVRSDIVQQLQLQEPRTFITGFARPNLRFEVEHALSEPDKLRTLLDFLTATPGAGIVYCATRKKCEELVESLQSAQRGRKVGLYHAGLEPDIRRRVQDDFMSDRVPIIVATNAFGMGIDKPDLRFVVHYNIPGSLEAYYQEAGRSGRDGLPSRCLLIYSAKDRSTQEWFIENRYPEPEVVEQVYDYLREIDADPIELTLEEIAENLRLQVRSEGVSASEKLLENCGALERLDSRQNRGGVRIDSNLPTLVDLLPREAKSQRKVMQTVEKLVGELRYERVFISPRQVADLAGMELAATNRALKELCKLQSFDYVPPFRGRAVHMLVRDKPFEELGIDFDEQLRLKDAEYAKLDHVIRYATSGRCRQLEILDYFGDPSKHACGTCDNCPPAPRAGQASNVQASNVQASGGRKSPEGHASEPASGRASGGRQPPEPTVEHATTPAVLNAVRMVLSGVARLKGRYGKQMVAKMLVGSKAKEMSRGGIDRLSTYGILSSLKESEALTLIDALLAVRLLMQVEETPRRPLVRVTPRGEQVMKGQTELTERLELHPVLIAKLEGVVRVENYPQPAIPEPPTPRERPKPIEDTSSEAFDAANVELAAAFDPDELLPSPAKHALHPPQANRQTQPPHYWTWRVLASGFSADECCQIRGLSSDELHDQLLSAAQIGQPVDPRWVLTPAQIAALDKIVSRMPARQLPEQLPDLPPGIHERQARLYLLSRAAGRGTPDSRRS